jgi:MSHA biogenesis protein MshK
MRYALATMCFLAGVAADGAAAQSLADPMRPPVHAPAESATATKNVGPVVHMIVIGPERRYAVINGQTVMQGDRFGDARVVRIAETEITLRGAGGEAVLKLLPQVQKKPTAPAAGEKGKK